MVVAVSAVVPAPLLGDGFEHLHRGGPALFGGLLEIAGGDLPAGLCHEPAAGRPVGLCGQGWRSWKMTSSVSGNKACSFAPRPSPAVAGVDVMGDGGCGGQGAGA